MLLFILAIFGFNFILPSALPQFLITRFVYRRPAHLDWRTVFHCPVCSGFWAGVFLGLPSGQNPILSGMASAGVLGLFEWLRNTLYAWAWALRLHFSREGRLVLEDRDLTSLAGAKKSGHSDPDPLDFSGGSGLNLINDYSRFEGKIRQQVLRGE